MRAAWVAVAALATALVVQLSVLNGLRLPGGGVPDLVLVLAASLAMAKGPVVGMITGFATGLCLDLAPPGGAVVGQYALVFCLAGWAAGRLSPVAGHSGRQSAGFLATALLAVVVAAAEVLSAGISLLVAPVAVTLSQIRVVLPSTIAYNLLLCPFVLSLVTLGGMVLADPAAGIRRFRGLADAAGHGASGGARTGTGRSGTRRVRLHPGSGVPGSASGLVRQPGRPVAPVHLRLAGGRRGDGAIGNALRAGGAGLSPGQGGRHPGLLAGSAHQFRPHPGEPGGSAIRSNSLPSRAAQRRAPAIRFTGYRGDGSLGRTLGHDPTRPGVAASGRRAAIRFTGHRGDGSLGRTLGHDPTRPGVAASGRRAAIRFTGHRGDGSLGRTLGDGQTRPGRAAARRRVMRFAGHRGDGSLGQTLGHGLTQPRPQLRTRLPSIRFGLSRGGAATGPLLRTGASRSAIAVPRTGPVPSVDFASQSAPVTRRGAAVPRFGRKSGVLRPARLSSGTVPGGVLAEATFRARSRRPTPRLRLAGGAPGMLGGTGRGPRLHRPQARAGKQPRFSYGKRSPLAVMTTHPVGRRLGGRWLAQWRVGSRSGVWLLGRRPGASR
jgi:rod shape-determining protein MreD